MFSTTSTGAISATEERKTRSIARRAGLGAAALAVAVVSLSACSSTQSTGNDNNAPVVRPTTLITGETRHTESHTDKPTSPTHTETGKSGGGGSGGGLGFDGQAFQQAMAGLGAQATGSEGGQGNNALGTMTYKFTGSGTDISSINCTAASQGGSVTQSDQNAQTLASSFLVGCATWNQTGDLKTQASNFVTSNLSKLEPEQPITQVVGATQLKLGKQAPGFYFLMLTQ